MYYSKDLLYMSELPNSPPRFPAQHVEEDGARGQAKHHLQDPAEPQVSLLLLQKSEVMLEVQRWDTNQVAVLHHLAHNTSQAVKMHNFEKKYFSDVQAVIAASNKASRAKSWNILKM